MIRPRSGAILGAVLMLLAPDHARAAETDSFDAAPLRPYAGRTIGRIEIEGLVRTREQAVRWLLGGREGGELDPDRWIEGVHRLYDTTVLYDVATRAVENREQVDLKVGLRDKWTILPYATFQGGGGSVNLGLGVFDTNLGGYFTNLSVGFSNLNGVTGYDLNLYQEWFRDTDWYFGLDVSRIGYPTSVYGQGGAAVREFSFFRNQQQLLIGRRLPQDVRASVYVERVADAQSAGDPAAGALLNGYEYWRARPTVVIGRSHLTNFLEQGSELSVGALVGPSVGATFSLKRTWIVGDDANLAAWASAGVMTDTAYINQYRLGGYDTVRGFATDRFRGTLTSNASVEFRPKLWSHRYSFLDLDWVVLQGAVFADLGWIFDRQQQAGLGLVSAGGGLRLIFVRFSNAILRLDWARSVSPSEGWDFSFGVGQFF